MAYSGAPAGAAERPTTEEDDAEDEYGEGD